jgi:hypothetical protein
VYVRGVASSPRSSVWIVDIKHAKVSVVVEVEEGPGKLRPAEDPQI